MQLNLKLTVLFCGFLFLLPKQAISLDTLFVYDDFEEVDVKDIGYLHITKNHSKDIQRILSLKPNAFESVQQTGLSFAPTDEVYWMRVILKNVSKSEKNLTASAEYPLMNLLQFYTVSSHGIDSSKFMGDNFAFYERPIEHHYFLHRFKLQPNEVKELYIYFNKANENIKLFTSISTSEAFHKDDKKNTIIWSIYIGLSLCLFLIIVSTAVFTRQKLIIYFALYNFSTFMVVFTNIGWGFHYLWSAYPAFNQVANYTFAIICVLSFLELTKQFLNMSETLPRLNKIYTGLQVLTATLSIVLFTFKTYPPLVLIIAVYVGHITLVLDAIVLLIAPTIMYRKTKNISYLAYILGYIFFISASITHLLTTIDVFEDTDVTRFSMPIGLTIDMIILMLIFGHRIQQVYFQNTQLQLRLNQTRLNAANLLLEGQLEERKRLSRELHDGISIKMAMLKMRLEQFFAPKNQETKSIINDLDIISDDIRMFTHDISPLNLEEETLEDAIEDLIYAIENQTNLIITTSLDSFDEQGIHNNQKHNLYQILRELLNNTIKYAKATHIYIAFSTIDKTVVFKYKDDGIGFNVEAAKSGIGLKNIRARVDLLNGASKIQSGNNGSQFEFRFSL